MIVTLEGTGEPRQQRERGREREREREREGGRQREREGGRQREREGGRQREREGERERSLGLVVLDGRMSTRTLSTTIKLNRHGPDASLSSSSWDSSSSSGRMHLVDSRLHACHHPFHSTVSAAYSRHPYSYRYLYLCLRESPPVPFPYLQILTWTHHLEHQHEHHHGHPGHRSRRRPPLLPHAGLDRECVVRLA
jgi:hypothetical protein